MEPRLIAGSNGLFRAQASLAGRAANTHAFASLYDLRSEGYRDHAMPALAASTHSSATPSPPIRS